MNDEQHTGPVVRVKHPFMAASAERVFDAFLDPAIARQFLFATPEGTMLRAEVDPRVGGRFCFVEGRAQGDAEHHGTYRVIERPRRLVFSFSLDAAVEGDEVSIEITPDPAGGCRLQLTHRMRPEWAEYADRTQDGWTKILE
ncbi:MAG: SRPBCC domain-containing protein, partial [Actinomycetota bacterium]|nr:SRPBCC domain-containing protein [Actinomycetota bacterium]